jgi:hypothetical protein
MVICPHNVSHATDVGMVEQADNGGLSGGPHLLGVVSSLTVGGALVLVGRLARYYLDSNLGSCQQDQN